MLNIFQSSQFACPNATRQRSSRVSWNAVFIRVNCNLLESDFDRCTTTHDISFSLKRLDKVLQSLQVVWKTFWPNVWGDWQGPPPSIHFTSGPSYTVIVLRSITFACEIALVG